MATSEVKVVLESRVATLSSVSSCYSHFTVSNELYRWLLEMLQNSLAHTSQEELLPCAVPVFFQTLNKQRPPAAELQSVFRHWCGLKCESVVYCS